MFRLRLTDSPGWDKSNPILNAFKRKKDPLTAPQEASLRVDDAKSGVVVEEEVVKTTAKARITSLKDPSASETVTYEESQKVVTIIPFDELPLWMQGNRLIRKGYRKPLGSFRACFWSLFYLHNESINVWSHLLPACVFLMLMLLADYPILHNVSKVSRADNYAIQVYIAGTAGCLLLSAFFHATNAHSEIVSLRFLKLDYLGIILTISTSCMSATYFGLYGQTKWQTIYITFTFVCAIATFWAVLGEQADGVKAAKWRARIFSALAVSGFAPIIHVAVLDGLAGLWRFPLENIAVTCSLYFVGTCFYVTRFPEKRWPGIFDIWGSSHQIFHTSVALGQIVFLLGLREKLLLQYAIHEGIPI